MERYDIFISYRREGGEMLAHILYERLSASGYRVFQDVESLRAGKFNEAIYDVIDSCQDVIVILSPNGLDRCVNEEDWLRLEIVRALQGKKNLVPVMLNGFTWPEQLPPDIADIRYHNALTASTDYFDMFLEKLEGFLSAAPRKHTPAKGTRRIGRYSLFAAYFLGLLFPLFQIFILCQPFVFWQRLIYAAWIISGGLWLLNCIETRPEFAAACFGTITEEDLFLTPRELYSRVISVFSPDILINEACPEGFVSYYKLRRLEFGSWDGKRINYLYLQLRRSLEYYDPSVLYLHALSHGYQASKMLIRQGFSMQTTPVNAPATAMYLRKGSIHVLLYYNKRRFLDHVCLYHGTEKEIQEKVGGCL